MNKQKNKNEMILKLIKKFPTNSIIYVVNNIIKFLPIIILTHDWEISNDKSYFHYVNHLTFCTLIDIGNNNKGIMFIYSIISILLILFFILILIVLFIFPKRYEKNLFSFSNIEKKIINFTGIFLFYLYYFLNQYFISIFAEILTTEKKDIIDYIFKVLNVLLILIMIFVSLLISNIINFSLFKDNFSLISNPITKTISDFEFIFPLIQFYIQLETNKDYFNKHEKILILIKNLLRGLYCIYFISKYFKNEYLYVNRTFHETKILFLNCCFCSCVIEWILYRKNTLIETNASKILKLIVEIIVGFVLFFYYKLKERNKFKNLIDNIMSNKKQKLAYNFVLIRFINLFYYNNDVQEINDYINILFKNASDEIIQKISINDFLNQKHNFNNNLKYQNSKKNSKFLVKNFPIFYSFVKNKILEKIQNENNSNLDESQANRNIENSFVFINLIYTFENNFFEIFFLLMKIRKNKIFNNSFFFKLKIKYLFYFLKVKFFNFIENEINSTKFYDEKKTDKKTIENSRKKIKNCEKLKKIKFNFKFLKEFILANQCINLTLKNFKNLIKKIGNENFEFNDKTLSKEIKDFINDFQRTIYFNENFKNRNQNFEIFYDFFKNEITEEINNIKPVFHYGEKSDKIMILKVENPSNLIHISPEDLDKTNNLNKNLKFKIEYTSPALNLFMHYTNIEFINLNFSEIFPKTFRVSYLKMFTLNFLENNYIFNEEIYIIDKEKFIYKVKVKSISLFFENGIKLYLEFINEEFCNFGEILLNKNKKIILINEFIEKNFFLNPILFTKIKVNIIEIFNKDFGEINSTFKYDLIQFLNAIFDLLNNDENIQKIGDEISLHLKNQIKYLLNHLKKNNHKICLIVKYEKKFIKITKKNFYTLQIYLFNPEKNNFFSNLEHYLLNGPKKNSIFLTNVFKKIDDIHKFHHNQKNKKEIIYRMSKIKLLSIDILNYFYHYNIKNTDIIENVINNEENSKNKTEEESSMLNKENPENEQNKFSNYLLIYLPPLSILFLWLVFIIVIIFFVLVIVCLVIKIKKLSHQEIFIQAYMNMLILHSNILNIFNIVLFHQLKLNNIHNIFFNDENFFSNKLLLLIKDLLNYQTRMKHFNRGQILSTKILFEILFNEKFYHLSPKINGEKYIETTSAAIDITALSILSKYLTDNTKNLSIFYNNSDYYFYLDDYNTSNNEEFYEKNESSLFYTKRTYILIIDNFLYKYIYYMGEYSNILMNEIIIFNLYGNFLESYILFFVGLGYCAFALIVSFKLIFSTQNSFLRYFVMFNQTIFFENLIIKKVEYIQELIDNTNNENFDYSKFDNSHKIILSKDYSLINKIQQNIKDNVFDDINNIKISPFKIKEVPQEQTKKGKKNSIMNIRNSKIIFKEEEESININKKKTFSDLLRKARTNKTHSEKEEKSEEINKINSYRHESPNKNLIEGDIKKVNFSSNDNNNNNNNNNSNNSSNNKNDNNNNNANNNQNQNNNNNNINNINNKNDLFLNFPVSISPNSNNSSAIMNQLNNSNNLLNKSNNEVINQLKKGPNKTFTKKKSLHNKKSKKEEDEKEEEEKENLLEGHKLLKKTFKYFSLKFIFPLVLIVYTCMNILEIKLTKRNNIISKKILTNENYLFSTIFFLQEALQIHILSILRNEEVTYNYDKNGYYQYCGNKIDFGERIVFNDVLICFEHYKGKFSELLNGEMNSQFSYQKNYLYKLKENDFCNTFAKEMVINQNDEKFILYALNGTTEIEYFNNCSNIGNFTTKGLITTIESFFTELENLHRDFNSRTNKNVEEFNYKLLNNENLILMIKTSFQLFDKIPISFSFSFLQDYNNYESQIKRILVIFCGIQIIMIILITTYFYYQAFNYIKEENSIFFFAEKMSNVILY